ncbi:MAG: hypothetical protein ABIQ17_07705 [Candidatus Limnocylindrales bacterium]
MATFGTSSRGTEPGGQAEEEVDSRLSRRDSLEALALLLGMFVIFLGLAFTMGASIVIGQ